MAIPSISIFGIFGFCYSIFAVSGLPTIEASKECRCFPGDYCWPSKAQWNTFNETLGGKLVATVPLAAPCHVDSFKPYDAEQCGAVQDTWWYPQTHYVTSSSVMAPFFANRSCDPFYPKDYQCVVGAYIQYAVNASTASDYQQTIAFAKSHNIRLVIRNTGHDYFGKSTGPGALGIWTHYLKDIEVLNYVSTTYSGKALKLGAGVQAFEAFAAAHRSGLVVVGGYCPTVGVAGGYSQGGGHSPLSSLVGLAADQVLEWEVVLSSGQVVVATPSNTYSDLYWALCGGGGGTYGAVLSMTSKAYPELQTIGGNLTILATGVSQVVFYDALETFLANLGPYVDAGGTANWLNTNEYFIVSPLIGPNMTKAQFDAFFSPTIAFLEENRMEYVYGSQTYSSFLAAYDGQDPSQNITNYSIGGRLIPRSVVESNTSALVAAIKDINYLGGGLSGVAVNVAERAEIPSNSVNPAWRKALVSLTVGLLWNDTDWDVNIANQALMTDTLIPALEAVSPGSGAYLNEGNFQQPDFQQVFYGDKYLQLLVIKNKYDPGHIFYGLTAVGSEFWVEEDDGRLCRVSS